MEKSTNLTNQRLRVVAANGIIMALYVAVTVLVAPVASGAIQFRISEGLNHLVVFNRKLMWGVVGGVVVYNLFFGMGILDVVFGGFGSFLALGATALVHKKIPNVFLRLAFNTIVFSLSMFLIAIMLNITLALPFWPTFSTTALSEFIVMTITAPVMYIINRAVRFDKRV
ncbi:QueT transporter family protein [Enterococcus casseliflavus]|uniref:QueT transporter family protein n=1 Tax=Enterococcus casseliflavus TaxID=37734 RepID=UPI0035DE40CF